MDYHSSGFVLFLNSIRGYEMCVIHIAPYFVELMNCIEGDTPFGTQYLGTGLDGTQYAKGWYAVRRNSVIYRTQTSIFTLKNSNFHQETQHT